MLKEKFTIFKVFLETTCPYIARVVASVPAASPNQNMFNVNDGETNNSICETT